MKNKVSLANAGYALFLLFFALEPLLGKWDAYWYALCGLAVLLGVVLVVGIVASSDARCLRTTVWMQLKNIRPPASSSASSAQRSAMSTMSRCSISGISWWCSKAPASWRGYSRRLKKQKSPVHFTTYWAGKEREIYALSSLI